MQYIMDNWASIVEIILAIIGLASIIVKLTPTTSDDKILAKVKNFVSRFIALNDAKSASGLVKRE